MQYVNVMICDHASGWKGGNGLLSRDLFHPLPLPYGLAYISRFLYFSNATFRHKLYRNGLILVMDTIMWIIIGRGEWVIDIALSRKEVALHLA